MVDSPGNLSHFDDPAAAEEWEAFVGPRRWPAYRPGPDNRHVPVRGPNSGKRSGRGLKRGRGGLCRRGMSALFSRRVLGYFSAGSSTEAHKAGRRDFLSLKTGRVGLHAAKTAGSMPAPLMSSLSKL